MIKPTVASANVNALSDLSELVHQRSRLAIAATLYELGEADFAIIRTSTGLTDGNLSRHLQILERGGIVTIRKGYAGTRPRTWVTITPGGRQAFESELRILRALVNSTRSEDSAPVRKRQKARQSGNRPAENLA